MHIHGHITGGGKVPEVPGARSLGMGRRTVVKVTTAKVTTVKVTTVFVK